MILTNSSSLTLANCSIRCSFQRTYLSGRHRAWSICMRTGRFLPGKTLMDPLTQTSRVSDLPRASDRSYDAGTTGESRRPDRDIQTPKTSQLGRVSFPTSVQVQLNGAQAHRSLFIPSSHSLLPSRLIDLCPSRIQPAPYLITAFRSKPIRLPSNLLL